MRLLSIETSTKNFSLAVSIGPTVIRYRQLRLKQVLSSSIIPAIERILNENRLILSQLDGFAVGVGPGSFTSLRVGVSTVKALAWASRKPVVGIPSLDILAMNASNQPIRQICTICDAKRNLLYACLYQKKNGQLQRHSPYLLIHLPELLDKIQEDTFFIGDGLMLFEEDIRTFADHNRWKASFAKESSWHPQAKQLAALAYQRFRQNKIDPLDKLLPLYLYPEDCQVKA
jgi:tRNA threonylcarbamoyladenosine biosynthesis protein TsaB